MCINCGWEDLLSKIDGMLDTGDFEWAENTLTGIHDTVESREHCTERQCEAIDNIENSLDR